MSANKTVVIAMSGGVDSSVTALLLKEQGYNCIGATMKLWDFNASGGNVNHESGCCSLDSFNDARMVCANIGIPYYVLDFTNEFNKEVVDDFVGEYLSGRTPNPCVLCNTKIKWQTMLDKAAELGADYLATGHYARVKLNKQSGRYELSRGVDEHKDQSYALWGLTQQSLSRTLFPLGEFSKPQVRELARKYGLRTAEKSESMEICFVPDNNYNRYLKKTVPGLNEKVSGGELVDVKGNVIGSHKGYPFFTIGQRRGIGTGFGKPMYVVDINAENNQVMIGEETYLFSKELTAGKVNLISVDNANGGLRAQVKIRYNGGCNPAMVYTLQNGDVRVVFDETQRAVTPGQSAVFYDGDCVLGGGIIDSYKKKG